MLLRLLKLHERKVVYSNSWYNKSSLRSSHQPSTGLIVSQPFIPLPENGVNYILLVDISYCKLCWLTINRKSCKFKRNKRRLIHAKPVKATPPHFILFSHLYMYCNTKRMGKFYFHIHKIPLLRRLLGMLKSVVLFSRVVLILNIE